MPERNGAAFPFAQVRHVPTRADYRIVVDDLGSRRRSAKVTAGALARAARALRWHERRAQRSERDARQR